MWRFKQEILKIVEEEIEGKPPCRAPYLITYKTTDACDTSTHLLFEAIDCNENLVTFDVLAPCSTIGFTTYDLTDYIPCVQEGSLVLTGGASPAYSITYGDICP